MKSIIISIKPKWTAKILNGEKTIEVRKTAPKCELPCEVYIYCTKGAPYLYELFNHRYSLSKIEPPNSLNGKVVAKFTLNKVELIRYGVHGIGYYPTEMSMNEMAQRSCLYFDEVDNYLKRKDGYAWHIDPKSLKIFDEPKELSDFERWVSYKSCVECPYGEFEPSGLCRLCGEMKPVTNAPQSYMFVEVDE